MLKAPITSTDEQLAMVLNTLDDPDRELETWKHRWNENVDVRTYSLEAERSIDLSSSECP